MALPQTLRLADFLSFSRCSPRRCDRSFDALNSWSFVQRKPVYRDMCDEAIFDVMACTYPGLCHRLNQCLCKLARIQSSPRPKRNFAI